MPAPPALPALAAPAAPAAQHYQRATHNVPQEWDGIFTATPSRSHHARPALLAPLPQEGWRAVSSPPAPRQTRCPLNRPNETLLEFRRQDSLLDCRLKEIKQCTFSFVTLVDKYEECSWLQLTVRVKRTTSAQLFVGVLPTFFLRLRQRRALFILHHHRQLHGVVT